MFSGGDGGAQSGGSGPDDQHVAEVVPLPRGPAAVVGVDPSQARQFAHLVFVKRKQLPRGVERLVVEPDGEKSTQPSHQRESIAVNSPQGVDRLRFQALLQGQLVGPQIRVRADGDQRVGVMVGQTVNTAGAVVFETPSQYADTVGPQRARQHVTGKTGVGAAFKTECQRAISIDPFAGPRWQTTSHPRAPACTGRCG